MNVQDKEMDELFRSRLGDSEMNPSPKVWDNVSAVLEAGRPKRRIAPLLRAAASVIVLLTAGILFFNKNKPVSTKTRVHKPVFAKTNTGNGLQMQGTQVGVSQLVVHQAVPAKHDLKATTVQLVQIRHQQSKRTTAPRRPEESGTSAASEQQPELLAAAEPRQIDVTNPVVPDVSLSNPPASADQSNNTMVTNTKVTQLQSTAKSKRQGFRSLGDIVNAVVAKVDKRADKVIEFSNTDDDESTITGLNLGIIKVKKEK